ncbi:MAG: APC family permease [Reyranellaceae bacterium]
MKFGYAALKQRIIGPARDPLAPETRHNMALVAFMAWVGLGADGLSSANYGPEEAFLALGTHTHLALYLAAATAITVFVISLAYTQVIEMFPHGGGGYKVAKTLIGPRAGLVSGSALIVDYVLTIAISIASGMDALFSLLPVGLQGWKLTVEIAAVLALLTLNLRGVKESLAVLVPLFLGFVVSHAGLIAYGIVAHAEQLPALVPDTLAESEDLIGEFGLLAFVSLLLRAFAMGGGTYTGIEAVSNNVHILREPRERTGRWTMLYMATSLALVAGGLIVLYLLWQAAPQEGRTLNAVTFATILDSALGDALLSGIALTATLVFAAALLFVAANTGFLGGPAVLANMAADDWAPHQFRQLSNRLVTQNGLLLMAGAAIGILLATGGKVNLLVVLYSINVFLTFTLCLFGLSRHWWAQLRAGRDRTARNAGRLALAGLGFVVCAGILSTTLIEKFLDGAWMTVLITGLVMAAGWGIHRHYLQVRKTLAKAAALFDVSTKPIREIPAPDPSARTAVFLVGRNPGTGMHTLLTALRLFPGQFRNCVFLTVIEVDADTFRATHQTMEQTRREAEDALRSLVSYCHRKGMAATARVVFAAETVPQLLKLAHDAVAEYPEATFFATQLMFEPDTWVTRLLHNRTATAVMRGLHKMGVTLVVLPMRLA